MLICSNCKAMYADNAVVNVQSKAVDFAAEDWTDRTRRKNSYMFLYGPNEPPFLIAKEPCRGSVSLSPQSNVRMCSLVDLEKYLPQQEIAKPLPVQTVVLPAAVPVLITHTRPAHIKPTWTFPKALAALDDAISYADGMCQVCKKEKQHTITESARTRWAAEMIHHYLGVLAVAGNPGFMIGVVINEGKGLICVAYSSNSASGNAQATLEGCKFEGYKLKLYGNEGFADISKSRGGRDISRYRNLSMVAVGDKGQRSSETCAASKLAKKFLKKDTLLSSWNMTEIAYGTMAGYTDGVAAESCVGCRSFLPTLLCGSSG